MTIHDWPTLALSMTIGTYWTCVGIMVARVRRDARRVSRVLIPTQRREKLMWLIWIPLIGAWGIMPFEAATQPPAAIWWKSLPVFATSPGMLAIRWIGVALALVFLGLSVVCWRHMGKDWRMGVDPAQEGRLIVDGPFAWVRHPIYALSIGLMLTSVLILPSPAFFVIATLHIVLMHIKAGNEEAFMHGKYGTAYDEYCARVGRFLPRPRRHGMPAGN